MNNKIKSILLIGIILMFVGIVTGIDRQVNNENIIKITALAGSPMGYQYVDEDSIKKDVEVFYTIKVSGFPSYTFTSQEMLEVKMNLNNLNSINQSIIDEVKNKAMKKWNWSLPDSKILYQPYSKP